MGYLCRSYAKGMDFIMSNTEDFAGRRIQKLKSRVIDAVPEVDIENAVILTRSFQETEGLPHVLRKAKGFYRQCAEKTVTIWSDELIAGCPGSKMRGGIVCADTCWSVLDDEIDTISTRRYDPFFFREEDKEIFLRTIKPYWKGKSTYEAWLAQIPEDTRLLRDHGMVYINRKAVRGFGETTAGYEDVINLGLKGIKEDILKKKAALDLTKPGDYEKDYYLDSLLVVADGIILLANRYAEDAEKQAAETPDPVRKKELLEIAQACRHVPENPASSFREAIQALYMYQISIIMEQNAASYNPGRLDQYLWPYYRADLENGAITEAQAQELLDCLWVKFSETCLFQDAETAEFAAGYPMFQNVCVGGVDTSGKDAVNPLSYLILQATMDVRLYQPSLSVRYSMAKNPGSFLRKVIDLIALGTGFPALHNDDIGIRMLMNKGIPLREAFDWNPCGCVETNLSGRLRQYTALADINLGGIVELALTNGVNRKSGLRISVESGDPAGFEAFGDFLDSVKKQLAHAVRAVVKGSHIIDEISMDRPCPALSLSFRECVGQAKDYALGGAKYNAGNGIILIGVADIINSIAAVKRLVYEDKTVTMDQLLSALESDFAGFEGIHDLCKSAPKYGNDDPCVDGVADEIFTFIADEIESYSSKFGKMTPGILPVSGNTPFGIEVGALPSGRKAYKPLADGVSPSGGTDFGGPSAILKSVSHIPHDRFVQGTLLNMKLEPEFMATPDGVRQMMALIKSMCTLGVYHIQFNVIDQKKLIQAQKEPEKFKGMLVRVAGYTAYFVELGKDVQDEIIGRTVLRG